MSLCVTLGKGGEFTFVVVRKRKFSTSAASKARLGREPHYSAGLVGTPGYFDGDRTSGG